MDTLVTLAVGLCFCVLLVIGARLLWWPYRRRPLSSIPDAVTVEVLRDIQISDGVGGLIQIDFLLLTARGLVVLDVKDVSGTIFAADGINEWTAMHRNQRFSFQNPQHTLDYRVVAVQQVVKGLPVFGHILFPRQAEFSKGKPKYVILPDEFLELYQKPDTLELERLLGAFYPYWEKVRDASEQIKGKDS